VPLAWQGEGGHGSGFDTLDKALVVWQDRAGHNTAKTGSSGNEGLLPPHRRVDIIISPWKTVGCAVLGWSGGTTFQRDIRRFCKKEKGLKFDSSGIRSREDGSWLDMEGPGGGWPGPAPDMETAERRVFAGLGLTYRAPEERCTG
jgi:DNA polymerase IV